MSLLWIALCLISSIGATDQPDKRELQAAIDTSKVNIPFNITSSPVAESQSSGDMAENPPSYYSFSGLNGLKLQVSTPRGNADYSYSLTFWFRSALNHQELRNKFAQKDAYLFSLKGVSCYIQKGKTITCSTDTKAFLIDLYEIPDLQAWNHLTFSANATTKKSTLRIDFPSNCCVPKTSPDQGWTQKVGPYEPVKAPLIYLAIDPLLKSGFYGHIREFFMTYGYLDPSNVPNVMNMLKTWDVSTMAYYRFTIERQVYLLKDNFRNQQGKYVGTSLVPGKSFETPIWHQEDVSNMICDTLHQYDSLARFENFKSGIIKLSLFKYSEKNVYYTLSMWIKSEGGHAYTTKQVLGRDNHHFFRLENAFALWWDSPSSFRVYVYTLLKQDEYSTKSVFMPLNTWVNVQISVSSLNGVTIKTLNTNGEIQQTVTNPKVVMEQRPAGGMIIFEDFKGMVRDLYLWQKLVTLPINAQELAKDASAIYQFNQKNFLNGWDSKTKYGYQQRIKASSMDGFSFTMVKVPNVVNVKMPQKWGQIKADKSLFDGVGCMNPQKNAFSNGGLLLNGQKGAGLTLTAQFSKTNSVTVELWFRFPAAPKKKPVKITEPVTNNIFLYTMNNGDKTDAMTIFIDGKDGNKLKCAPFGIDSGPDSILVYADADPIYQPKWQYVRCSYSLERAVTGTYIVYNSQNHQGRGGNITDNKFDKNQLLTKTYAFGLAASSKRNKNYVWHQKWQIIIGNDKTLSLAQNVVFQNVRMWSNVLPPTDSFQYLFIQPKIGNGLILSLPLLTGDYTRIHNRATRDSKDWIMQLAKVFKGKFIDSPKDKNLLICGTDRYFNLNTGLCQTFPFQVDMKSPNPNKLFMPVTKIMNEESKTTLSMRFIRNGLVLPDSKLNPKPKSFWQTEESQNLFNRIKVQQNEPDLKFDRTNDELPIRTTYINENGHNYYIIDNQEEKIVNCLKLADTKSDKSVTKINVMVVNNTVEDDLCFKFEKQDNQGIICTRDYTPKIQKKYKIRTSPVLPESFVNSVVQNNKREYGDQFDFCFPKNQTSNPSIFPRNEQVNFVFSTFWEVPTVSKLTHLDIVYEVTLIDPINVKLGSSLAASELNTKVEDILSEIEEKTKQGQSAESQVDQIFAMVDDPNEMLMTEVQMYENVTLDGSGSTIRGYDDNRGIVFKWVCPAVFQTWCDSYYGSPILEIPYDTFISHGGQVKEQYNFTLSTKSVFADSANPAVFFNRSTVVEWKELPKPDFNIELSSDTYGSNMFSEQIIDFVKVGEYFNKDALPVKVLATEANELKVALYNYRLTDPDLQYRWTLSPESLKRPIMSADMSALMYPEGALNNNTNYTLTVIVDNQQSTAQTRHSRTIHFMTAAPIKVGSISILPGNGVMLQTNFNIKMQGWAPSSPDKGPLTYTLFAVQRQKDKINSVKRTQLTERVRFKKSSNVAEDIRKLPSLIGIQVEIRDKTGQMIMIEKQLDVRNPDAGTLSVATIIKNKEMQRNNQFQYLTAFAGTINLPTNKDKDKDKLKQQIKKVNSDFVKHARSTLKEISKSLNDVTKWKYRMAGIASLLAVITENSQNCDVATMVMAKSLFLDMERKARIFNTTFKESNNFIFDLISIAANIMKFTDHESKKSFKQYSTLKSKKKAAKGQKKKRRLSAETDKVLLSISRMRTYTKQMLQMINRITLQLCRIKNEKKFITPHLQIATSTLDLRYDINKRKDIQYMNVQDGSSVFVPVDELKRQTMDLNSQSTKVCNRIGFTKLNPANTFQFKQQKQVYEISAFVSTLDNTLNEITAQKTGGMRYLERRPFGIQFAYNYESFVSNQTQCMSIDPMEEQKVKSFQSTLEERIFVDVDKNGPRWSMDGCQTTYKDRKDGNNAATLVCRCNVMNNKYFSVVNDYTRLSADKNIDEGQYLNSLLLVIVPMAIFIVLIPLYVIYLDDKDYTSIENDTLPIQQQLYEQIKDYRKMVHIEEAYYNQRQIFFYIKDIQDKFYKFSDPSQYPGSLDAFKISQWYFHPFVSVFLKFDYRVRRLTRLALVMIQTNVIALLAMTATFKLTQLGGIFAPRSDYLIVIAAVLGLLTLPLPECLVDILRAKIMSKTITVEEVTDEDKPINEDKEESDEDKDEIAVVVKDKKEEKETVLYLHDPGLQIKVALVSSAFFLYFAVFGLLLAFFKRGGDKDSWFMVTRDQCHNFVMIYYLSIVFFGWYILNSIRSLFICNFAARQAVKIQKEIIAEERDEVKVKASENCQCCYCGDRNFCSCFFVPKEAIEMYLECLVVIRYMEKCCIVDQEIADPQHIHDDHEMEGNENEGADDEERNEQPEIEEDEGRTSDLAIKGQKNAEKGRKVHAKRKESLHEDSEESDKPQGIPDPDFGSYKVKYDGTTGLPQKRTGETPDVRNWRLAKEKEYGKTHKAWWQVQEDKKKKRKKKPKK